MNKLKVCDDGDSCTEDSCDPKTGECLNEPRDCDDGNLCTEDSCDPETGECKNSLKVCVEDDNLCTRYYCDPDTGKCKCECDWSVCNPTGISSGQSEATPTSKVDQTRGVSCGC